MWEVLNPLHETQPVCDAHAPLHHRRRGGSGRELWDHGCVGNVQSCQCGPAAVLLRGLAKRGRMQVELKLVVQHGNGLAAAVKVVVGAQLLLCRLDVEVPLGDARRHPNAAANGRVNERSQEPQPKAVPPAPAALRRLVVEAEELFECRQLALVPPHHLRGEVEPRVVNLDRMLRRPERHGWLAGDGVERVERDGDVGPVPSKGREQEPEDEPHARDEREDGGQPAGPDHERRPPQELVAGSSPDEGCHATLRRRPALVLGGHKEARHDHLVAHLLADVWVLDDAAARRDAARVQRLGRPDARVDEEGEGAKDARGEDGGVSAVDHLATPARRQHGDAGHSLASIRRLLYQQSHNLGAKMEGAAARPGRELLREPIRQEIAPLAARVDAAGVADEAAPGHGDGRRVCGEGRLHLVANEPLGALERADEAVPERGGPERALPLDNVLVAKLPYIGLQNGVILLEPEVVGTARVHRVATSKSLP
mmetsp:Transcript_37266/g.119523  ORF Transcript_37266/g.119523 Transcript_37266/m.119523 type:complete len:482 (-) Transcript_37266:402-1847(-)